MYGPAPSRVNKTGITRSRSGCLNCRKRRKKCDEKRPCSSCQKLGVPCQQPTKKLAFRPVSFAHAYDPDPNQPNTSASVIAPAESELCAQTPEVIQDGTSLSIYTAGSIDSDPIDPLTNHFTSFLDDYTSQTGSPGFVDTPSILDANVSYEDYVISPSLLKINGLDQACEGLSNEGSENTGGNAPLASLQSQLVLPVDNDCQLSMGTSRAFGQLIFYSDVWDTHCLPGLHPALRGLGRSWQMPALLKDAVLALAACQLSRMTPQTKSFDPKGIPGLSFRPDLDHQAVSCEKYGSALMRLASWSDVANTQGFNEALAGMTLLAHLESLMGGFRQFASHRTGIDALLCQLTNTNILPDHSTCQFIANWTQARAQNWWLRFHFSTPDHHRRSPSMACSPWLTSVLEEAQDSRSIIMLALCECCRLTSTTFLSWWDKSDDLNSDHGAAATQVVPVEEPLEQHTRPKIAQIAETVDADALSTSAIASLRATLDRWHTRIPLSQLPIESFMEPPNSALLDQTLPFEVRPLRFNFHHNAMDYAYYVLCRLLLCSCEVYNSEIQSSLPQSHSVSEDTNLWALLLARIVAGLSWDECLMLNRYIIGLTSLFLPAILHCSEPRIGLWLQDWIEQRYTSTALEEGSFPVLQVLQPLRAVNREHRQGRDIKAVYICVEDEGGRGKYDSYNSQHVPSLLAYSRICSTGQSFSETLWL